jgi:hypothetical protein
MSTIHRDSALSQTISAFRRAVVQAFQPVQYEIPEHQVRLYAEIFLHADRLRLALEDLEASYATSSSEAA